MYGAFIVILQVYSGRLLILGILIMEISNPLLQTINILNLVISKKKITKNHILISLVLKSSHMTLFIFTRFIWYSYVMTQAIFIYGASIHIIILCSLIALISIGLLPELIKDLRKTRKNYQNPQNISYEQVNVISSGNEDDINLTGLHMTMQDQYEHVITTSKKSVIHFFVAGAVYSFFHTNRMSVYLLYAEEFNPSTLQIAFLLYGEEFWNGIACLIYGALANQYGYDRLLICLLVLQCIAVGLESIATSFYVLFAGIILGQVGITYIVFGYIAWILPHKQATRYTSYFYATFMATYLIGPISAGIVSYYVSNSLVESVSNHN